MKEKKMAIYPLNKIDGECLKRESYKMRIHNKVKIKKCKYIVYGSTFMYIQDGS